MRAAISASDHAFAREAALARAGIAVMPSVTVERDLEKKRLVPVLEGYAVESSADLYLVHPGTRLIPPKPQRFAITCSKPSGCGAAARPEFSEPGNILPG
ncbi:MAG TPA: LysR substrate-binding domain-containing protein [Polyangiaceae bacterium]|nr:LysR substrate-binding domain-containing protein [Polyangiaceae bacterium]